MVDIDASKSGDDYALIANDRRLRLYPIAKRSFDLAVVLMFAPGILCLIAILAVLVRLDGGAAFYRQPRVGVGGRIFMLWKLRTMVPDADRKLEEQLALDPQARLEWNQTQKLKADSRVTAVGYYLRKYSLDELPQLINVFVGDMSLVGPRPFLPEQRQMYDGKAYYRMRPGLTGLWQVGKRNESTFAERAVIDTDYFRRMSFFTDMWILSRTPLVVVRGTGV